MPILYKNIMATYNLSYKKLMATPTRKILTRIVLSYKNRLNNNNIIQPKSCVPCFSIVLFLVSVIYKSLIQLL